MNPINGLKLLVVVTEPMTEVSCEIPAMRIFSLES